MRNDLSIKVYLDLIRRRTGYFLLPALLAFVAGIVAISHLPRVYEATAKILVESNRIPTELASPTVAAGAVEQIEVILQHLMTRDSLLQIAEKFSLYDDAQRPLSPDLVVERVRQATHIGELKVPIEVARRSAAVVGFTVSFESADPETAADVANELVAAIVSRNLESRLSRAAETSSFFEQKLVALDAKLEGVETRIAEFKRENELALPEGLPYRRTLLLQLRDELAKIDSQIRLTSQPEQGGTEFAAGDARLLDQSLRVKQQTLASIREERASLAPLAERGIVSQNRIRDIDRDIASAELEVAVVENEIAKQFGPGGTSNILESLADRRAELADRIAEINGHILATPQVELELATLTREYENLKAEYQQAQTRLAEAVTGERLEENRQTERFELFERASVPETPIKPEKRKLMLAGSFGSLVIGLAVAVVVELLDRSIRTVGDLERRLQLRPLATIPYVASRSERRLRRWRLSLLTGLGALTVAAALWLVHLYLLPLDAYAEQLTQQIGF